MKLVYVTGCLGFIGSYVTRKCLERGWRVYGIDKETYVANTTLLQEFLANDNFEYLNVDIKDLEHLYDCDYVINTAAESHVGNSIISSKEFIDSNIVGVQNLLDLIKNKPINCNRRPIFFHFSTDEVYGDIVDGEHIETDLLHPSNPYSAAKAAADMLVMAWSRTYDLEYILLRPTNNYGIGQYPEKLIPLTIFNASKLEPIRIYGDGENIRDWIYVFDHIDALISVANEGEKGETYCIGANNTITNNYLVKSICEILDDLKPENKPHSKLMKYIPDRLGHDYRYAIDSGFIKRSIGWH